jgi:nucleotide-binding universal stress UspA family protein
MLAIDNDDNARAGILLTDGLAARGAIPSVIRTVEVMSPTVGSPDSMVFYANAVLGEDFFESQQQIIVSTIESMLGSDRKWPVKTAVGEPATTIVSEAEAYGADLLVMGVHHHGLFEQALGENTATRVMSRAAIPVLGVRAETTTLPRRIMVATDFGNASVEAAHLAANLADPDGVVVLVHVAFPVPVIEEGDEGAALVQREGIGQAFANLSAAISEGKKIRVETVTRTGDPSTQLLAAAEEIAPDMIAIASQRHHLFTRLMLGSVSRKLVRDGHWSIIVSPPLNTKNGTG